MSIRENIVELAKSLEGKVQYVFGANNPNTMEFDCSSFTQYVYKRNGVSIGRDTISQSTGGEEIAKTNLEKGDLVFFKDTYRKGVSHVGIYIGGGKFIHNSSTKNDVIVSNLSDTFWKNHWYGARRYIESENSVGNGYNEMTGEWEVKDGTEPQKDETWVEEKIGEFINKYLKKISVGVIVAVVGIFCMFFIFKAVEGNLTSVTDNVVNDIVRGEK